MFGPHTCVWRDGAWRRLAAPTLGLGRGEGGPTESQGPCIEHAGLSVWDRAGSGQDLAPLCPHLGPSSLLTPVPPQLQPTSLGFLWFLVSFFFSTSLGFL